MFGLFSRLYRSMTAFKRAENVESKVDGIKELEELTPEQFQQFITLMQDVASGKVPTDPERMQHAQQILDDLPMIKELVMSIFKMECEIFNAPAYVSCINPQLSFLTGLAAPFRVLNLGVVYLANRKIDHNHPHFWLNWSQGPVDFESRFPHILFHFGPVDFKKILESAQSANNISCTKPRPILPFIATEESNRISTLSNSALESEKETSPESELQAQGQTQDATPNQDTAHSDADITQELEAYEIQSTHKTETEPNAESELKTESSSEPETKADAGSKPESKAEAGSESEQKLEADAESELEPEPKAEFDSQNPAATLNETPKTQDATSSQTEGLAQTHATHQPETKIKTEQEPQTSQPLQADSKTNSKVELTDSRLAADLTTASYQDDGQDLAQSQGLTQTQEPTATVEPKMPEPHAPQALPESHEMAFEVNTALQSEYESGSDTVTPCLPDYKLQQLQDIMLDSLNMHDRLSTLQAAAKCAYFITSKLDAYLDDASHMLKRAWVNSGSPERSKPALAYDACNVANILITGADLGYLETREVLQLCEEIKERLLQNFSSWEEYVAALQEQIERTVFTNQEFFTALKLSIKQLQSCEYSPWNEFINPWPIFEI